MGLSLVVATLVLAEQPVIVLPQGPEFDVMPGDTSGGTRIVMDENSNHLTLFINQFSGSISLRGGLGVELEPTFFIGPGARGADIAATGPGEFVVSWSQMPGYGRFGPAYEEIMIRRFALDGTPISETTTVGDVPTMTIGGQTAIGKSSNDYWVVWEQYQTPTTQLRVRRIPIGGSPGPSIQANSWTTGSHYAPRIAASPTDQAMITWRSEDCFPDDSSEGCIRGRYIDSAGTLGPSDFLINSITTGYQAIPSVAASTDGFVVVWRSSECTGSCIRGRRLNSEGIPLASDFRVDEAGSDSVAGPDVTAASNGTFLVSWVRTESGNSLAYARAFDAEAVPQTSEFRVNSSTTSEPYETAIAQGLDGQFVVVWSHGYSMWGRSFKLWNSLFQDGFESGDTSAWSVSLP